jgi:hypothetical protein
MKQADAWIATYRRFWEGSLDALADYLERGLGKTDDRAVSIRAKTPNRKK